MGRSPRDQARRLPQRSHRLPVSHQKSQLEPADQFASLFQQGLAEGLERRARALGRRHDPVRHVDPTGVQPLRHLPHAREVVPRSSAQAPCPEDVSRKSFALYYFRNEGKKQALTPTNYQATPDDSAARRALIAADRGGAPRLFVPQALHGLKRQLHQPSNQALNPIRRRPSVAALVRHSPCVRSAAEIPATASGESPSPSDRRTSAAISRSAPD